MTQPSQPTPEYQTRTGLCPKCGGPSTEARLVVKDGDLSKPWTRYDCGTCQDTAADAARHLGIVSASAVTEKRLAQLDVPPLYADATLDSFDLNGTAPFTQRPKLEKVQRAATRYLAAWPDVPLVTLFAGSPGTGKGHIAWSLARAVVETKQGTARVCVLSDVIRDLREAWSSREEGGLSEAQRLSRYRSVDLLVIDEVSRHAFYGQPQQHLYDLVAWREVRMKPTILTTNETGDSLSDMLGPALLSRVLGWGPVWHFGEGDYRITRAKAGQVRPRYSAA